MASFTPHRNGFSTAIAPAREHLHLQTSTSQHLRGVILLKASQEGFQLPIPEFEDIKQTLRKNSNKHIFRNIRCDRGLGTSRKPAATFHFIRYFVGDSVLGLKVIAG